LATSASVTRLLGTRRFGLPDSGTFRGLLL
jgi:hypothetical protein